MKVVAHNPSGTHFPASQAILSFLATFTVTTVASNLWTASKVLICFGELLKMLQDDFLRTFLSALQERSQMEATVMLQVTSTTNSRYVLASS
jgi:hypothetical protein